MLHHGDDAEGTKPSTKLSPDMQSRKHFDAAASAARARLGGTEAGSGAGSGAGGGTSAPSVRFHQPDFSAPAATPQHQRPARPPSAGTKIMTPKLTPMDVSGASAAAVQAAFERLNTRYEAAPAPAPAPRAAPRAAASVPPPPAPMSVASMASASSAGVPSRKTQEDFPLAQRRHNTPAHMRDSNIFSAPQYPVQRATP